MSDSDMSMRGDAMHALAQVQTPEAIDALLSALAAPEEEHRISAIWALRDTNEEVAIDALRRVALNDSVPEARQAAIRVLYPLNVSDFELLVQVITQDSDAQVRERALISLYAYANYDDINMPPSVTPAAVLMLSEADVHARYMAVGLLASIGDPATVSALANLLADTAEVTEDHFDEDGMWQLESSTIAEAAVRALKRIGTPEALAALRTAGHTDA